MIAQDPSQAPLRRPNQKGPSAMSIRHASACYDEYTLSLTSFHRFFASPNDWNPILITRASVSFKSKEVKSFDARFKPFVPVKLAASVY